MPARLRAAPGVASARSCAGQQSPRLSGLDRESPSDSCCDKECRPALSATRLLAAAIDYVRIPLSQLRLHRIPAGRIGPIHLQPKSPRISFQDLRIEFHLDDTTGCQRAVVGPASLLLRQTLTLVGMIASFDRK